MKSHCRIFIKRDLKIEYFMWADYSADHSVYLGLPWEGKETLQAIFEEKPISTDNIITQEYQGKTKVSFHSSGNYKLESCIGHTIDSMDRITVAGPQLDTIKAPRRMAEILLPEILPTTRRVPTDNDIVLDLSGKPVGPLRCSIFCLTKDQSQTLKSPLIDTSIFEISEALETNSHYWIWTLRQSKDDTEYPNKLFIMLPGDPKWGEIYASVDS